ncbi:unnamed protein product, partial [Tetraodon nigroviridis]
MSEPAAGPGSWSRSRSVLGSAAVRPIGADTLVALLEAGLDQVVLVDCRPFVDYNTSHILEAINVNCSKLMKRRLQQDKVQIGELLQHAAKRKLDLQAGQDVVVYDQDSDLEHLSPESFLSVVLLKLERSFTAVHLLSGGFLGFSKLFPGLCEGKSFLVPSCISQPCLPVSSTGPTRILPHLYLGCQRDVLNQDLMQQNDIGYDPERQQHLPQTGHSSPKKAKASNGRVLVHCLAGISRSATIAIAYIMKRMELSLDEAYRFVKEKRPTISPNFNFLGQLLDFEKRIKSAKANLQKREALVVPEDAGPGPCPGRSGEAPGELPCVLEPSPDEGLLDRALSGLHFPDGSEEGARLKRSFSLDIKSFGDGGPPSSSRAFGPRGGGGDSTDPFRPAGLKEAGSKACQFSPVEEVSEQSTPERSPDKEVSGAGPLPPRLLPSNAPKAPPPAPKCWQPLQRSGSLEGSAASYLFGLSRGQQPPGPGGVLKGWHSDILLGPVGVSTSTLAAGWFLSDSAHLLPTSLLGGSAAASYGCGPGVEAVRRRGGQRAGDGGASRRSWHEESSFEKQLKRRSCQMESGDGRKDARAREDAVRAAGQASFSGSLELIQVS